MNRQTDKEAALARLEETRRALSDDLSGLGGAVNVPRRFQDAVRRHPAWWIGGGVAAGVVLSALLRPSGRRRKRDEGGKNGAGLMRPMFLGLLGFAGKQILRLSAPALKQVAEAEVERWLANRSAASPPDDGLPRA
ncbi:MAG: hypothetical protein KDM91_03790 [Verrucomicrobiae bacterium]|nr:hypothetical protein [Verrucomicrobiae bacterium]MCP5540768.1 hypothetical protein [Akkermansiaceae bacterium]MCP5551350.1 hypothetical protein [Akkermansiaceae bacterium]